MLPYHRADFLQVLQIHTPTHYKTHFGKRLESFVDSPSGPVTLRFKDGSTAECDLLIGADGIKSAVRKSMYEQLSHGVEDSAGQRTPLLEYLQFLEPRWTGQVAYRALVTREELEAACPGHESLHSPIIVSLLTCIIFLFGVDPVYSI